MEVLRTVTVVLLMVVCQGGWIWFVRRVTRCLRHPESNGTPWPETSRLDWPDIAFLSGGPLRVFQAATVWLVQHQIARYDANNRRLSLCKPLPDGAPSAVAEVYNAARKGGRASIDNVRLQTGGGRQDWLVQHQLCYSNSRRASLVAFGIGQFILSMLPGCLPFLAACLLLGEPVTALGVVMMSLTLAGHVAIQGYSFMAMCYLTSRRLTPLGERVLAREQRLIWPDRPLWYTFYPPPELHRNHLALVVAAFGDILLRHSALKELEPGLSEHTTPGD